MATIHRDSFYKGWPVDDFHAHVKADLCLCYSDPSYSDLGHDDLVSAYIIVQIAGDQAEILTIAVSPPARRQGLARHLLEAVEKILIQEGVAILFLEVAEDNQSARALYKSTGFEAFSRRPAYYRREKGRVAAITFRKALDASPASL